MELASRRRDPLSAGHPPDRRARKPGVDDLLRSTCFSERGDQGCGAMLRRALFPILPRQTYPSFSHGHLVVLNISRRKKKKGGGGTREERTQMRLLRRPAGLPLPRPPFRRFAGTIDNRQYRGKSATQASNVGDRYDDNSPHKKKQRWQPSHRRFPTPQSDKSSEGRSIGGRTGQDMVWPRHGTWGMI